MRLRCTISIAAAIVLVLAASSKVAFGCIVDIPANYSRMEKPPQEEDGAPMNVTANMV